MKKILLILSLFIYSFANADCNSAIQTAKNYVDTYIVPNGQNAITGQRANAALNYIITALKCVDTISDLSFTKNSTRDSFVIVYKGVRFAVKDSIGIGGGGGSQTLSISNDTLTISNGNSVILPIYFQSDSATITSYDVLNSQNAPPISPNTGDTYLVGTSPSGAWVGHAKDIAEWNGSSWDFTDGVQGDFLYNATTALTYIFRSGNWVQTTGIPALNNGNTISSGLKIGTNNLKSLTFETNNKSVSRFDSIGRFYVYDTALRKSNKFLQIDSSTGRLIASDIFASQNISNTSLTADGGYTIDGNANNFTFDNYKVFSINATEGSDNIGLDLNGTAHALGVSIIGESNTYQGGGTGVGVKITGTSVTQSPNEDNDIEINPTNGRLKLSNITTDNTSTIFYMKDENGRVVESDGNVVLSNKFIPLTGTESGHPVTGDIEFSEGIGLKTANADADGFHKVILNTNGIVLSKETTGAANSLQLQDADYIYVSSTNSAFRGITLSDDFSANATDFDLVQKKYVGYRGTATLVDGNVTVTTDKIKTGWKIYLSVNTPSGTQGFLSAPTGSIVDETEFVINSTSATDDSTVNWWIAP